MQGIIKPISSYTASDFLLPRHYSGRIPTISYAFGWYDDNNKLQAVITYGKPASNSLCQGVCGEEESYRVYELNRLCREDNWSEPLSQFVAYTLRELSKEDLIIISYSDTGMNHHGYIYQACNFIYTGCTKERTDKFVPNGKHSRHYDKNAEEVYRKVRTPKHRYIYFCTNNKKLKKKWKSELKYEILPYPKGDNNQDYILGNYMKDTIIEKATGNVVDIPKSDSTVENSYYYVDLWGDNNE